MEPDALQDPRLDADRAAYRAGKLDAEQEQALWEAVRSQAEADSLGWRGRLRALPGGVQIVLGLLGLVVVGQALTVLQGLRGDLPEQPDPMWTGAVLSMVALAAVSVATALRGVHLPERRVAGLVVGIASLTVPFAVGLVPTLWPGGPVEPGREALVHVACFSFSGLAAVGGALVLMALMRQDRPAIGRVLAAAGAGGILGFLVQLLHCMVNQPIHLALTHGLAGGLVALALVLRDRWAGPR